jgi:ubiquinone/menaquinone biosynthesis C-methylase UbiE
MGTFWDFCAPFYDIAEKTNGRAYDEMLTTVTGLVPQGATALEAAAGTGAISLAVANKASRVLCTDLSERMLHVARRKIAKRNIDNITIKIRSIYALEEPDASFDVVIAGQVLHLIDEPEKAAAELKRVAKSMVILPMSLTKNIRGMAKFGVGIYRLFGFAPKIEFSADAYKTFLPSIGFNNCEYICIDGKIPMIVGVYKKDTVN